MDWKNPANQRQRFQIFEELIKMAGYGRRRGFESSPSSFSILDVGCGFGDLYAYLKKCGYKFTYTGYDLAPSILETARKKHPGIRFENKDILKANLCETFDYVFCSGALNINLEEENSHMEYARAMLLKMYHLCKKAVGVNFLSAAVMPLVAEEDIGRSQYFYFKPEEIISFCSFICRRYVLRHDYNAGDFTVYLIK